MVDTSSIPDFVNLLNNSSRLYADFVTAERQKWREYIRKITIETANIAAKTELSHNDIRKLHAIRAEFRVRLNLDDPNDRNIVECLTKIIEQQSNYQQRLKHFNVLEIEVSWLLKEDWERIKYDTRPV